MIAGIFAAQRVVPAQENIAQTILNNLISWWDFEQASGLSFTDSKGTNSLFPSFDASLMSTASGKVGRAMDISTTNEYAYAANSTTFNFGNQSFTHFFWHIRNNGDNPGAGVTKWIAGKWYSASGANQRAYAVSVIGGTPDVYRALINSDGTGASSVTVDGPEYLSTAGSDFVAYGYDSTADQLFLIVNGTKTTAAQTAGAFAGSTARFAFGSQVDSGLNATAAGLGGYDSAGVMNSAITPAQYNLLYNSGSGLNYAGLLALL